MTKFQAPNKFQLSNIQNAPHPPLSPKGRGESFGHWYIGYYLMIGVWDLVFVHFNFPIKALAMVFFWISFVPS